MNTPIVKDGWLEKQGGFIPSWKNRFFVLTKNKMQYFRVPYKEEMGQFSITSDCSVQKAPECKRGCAFKVITPKRAYLIVANSETDRDDWIAAVQSEISGIPLKQQLSNVGMLKTSELITQALGLENNNPTAVAEPEEEEYGSYYDTDDDE